MPAVKENIMSLSAVAVLATIVAISIGEGLVRRIVRGGKSESVPLARPK